VALGEGLPLEVREEVVTQFKFVLRADLVDFVVEHLLVRVQPERNEQAKQRRDGHYPDCLESQFLAELRWKAIKVAQGEPVDEVLDANCYKSNEV